MNAIRLLLLAALFVATAFAKEPKKQLRPGLVVTEYPRHVLQSSDDQAYLDHEKFGKPIGETKRIETLAPWKWNAERNAVARGFLTVEKDGDYAFTTDSFYDRNALFVDGKLVCKFRDGGDSITTVPLKRGVVEILSVGFIESRGSATVRWRPPGQRELGPIPAKLLRHYGVPPVPPKPEGFTIVAKDFVIEAYKNGVRIPEAKRKFLLDRYGATAERIDVRVQPGDWLVFHVANNRLRHKGTKFFALSGPGGSQGHSIVSDPNSPQWSSCDDPGRAGEFIRSRDVGTEARAVPIARPWEEGMKFMRKYAGDDFPGKPIWGAAPSTWLKYVVPGGEEIVPKVASSNIAIGKVELTRMQPVRPEKKTEEEKPEEAPEPEVIDASIPIEDPKRWSVQVLSATYGTGGKNADVTARVKQLVEERKFFAANPGHLKADPNPGWNKGLHIVYMKDGVRREQRRNENEHILPESFYGPHDAAELEEWLEGTRWFGPKGEIQFHRGRALTGPGIKRTAQWEATGKNGLRITWDKDNKTEFRFNYTWSGFYVTRDGKNVYRILK